MPQYAYFDSAKPAPSPVIGWYDTGFATYPNLPGAGDLLKVTAAQWSDHMADPAGWAVQNGALVAYTAPTPTPTLAQQAAAMLAAGLAVSSTSDNALDGTYALNTTMQLRLSSLLQYFSLNGTFPNKATTMTLLDMAGTPHVFTQSQLLELYTALGNYLTVLEDVQTGISTTLPVAADYGAIA